MNYNNSPRWKTNLSKLLIASLVFPTGLVSSGSVAKASGSEVVINEIKVRGAEYIELYNKGSESVDLDGWTIVSAANGLASDLNGEIESGEIIQFETDNLDNKNDVVSLKDSQGSTQDYLSYGYGRQNLPTADIGKSMARKTDGSNTWLSNVEPSLGWSNNYSGPMAPFNLRVSKSELNPANTINNATQNMVKVDFELAGESANTEIQAWDLTGKIKDNSESDLAKGQNSIDLDLSSLADGSIYLSAYNEDVQGVRSMWSTPVTVGKDTDGPLEPVISRPATEVETKEPTYLIKGSAPKANLINVYRDNVLVAKSDLSTADFEISVPLVTGKNKFEITARDQAWNWSDETEVPTITAANLPIGVPTNLTAEVDGDRVKLNWDEPIAGGEVEGYKVYTDNQSGTINYDLPISTQGKNDTSFKTDHLGPGRYKFVVRSFNKSKESASSNLVEAMIKGEENIVELNKGEQTVNLVDDHQFWLKTSPDTLENTTFTVEDFGHFNPTNEAVLGQVAVGSYYDVTSSNNSPFPIEIRLFYTQDDLDSAGVTDEAQLVGINYFDEMDNSWHQFSESGVDIDEITIDGQQFKGFFWAKTDHLTPIVGTADIEAPQAISNFKATVGDEQVRLNWDKNENADSYSLRYKTNGGQNYTYLNLNSDQTEILILNLTNYANYQFEIAAMDQAKNMSPYTSVSATPIPPSEELAIGGQVGPISLADTSNIADSNQDQGDKVSDGDDQKPDDSDQGDIKGGDDERSQTENTRNLVTILIIVVAAAAGFGGYYAYQWWTAQPDDINLEDNPPKKEKEIKKKSRRNDGGRW